MNAEKAVGWLTEIIRWRHLTLTAERSDCAWLRQHCDNLKGLLFHVPSEPQIEWFLIALWWGMVPLPARKVKFGDFKAGRNSDAQQRVAYQN